MTPNREMMRLRDMLDGAGIEWQSGAFGDMRITYWKSNGVEWCAIEHDDGRLVVNMGIDVTPEQAIAATVGVGTCQIETTESWLPAERYHRCKHCGAFFAVLNATHDIPPRVCPNCGRRIIEEVTE